MSYDELGRQTTKVWPDGSTERYGYDVMGNRISQALSDGVITNTFSYDNLNRLRQANYASAGTGTLARTVVYTYTATGQRQSVNDSSYGTTSYSYDNRDRVVQIQQPQIGTVAAQSVGYGYDERSNRTVMTTTAPSASLVAATSYGYDAVGRLQSVLGPNDGGTPTTYSYLDNGLRNQQTLSNGIISQYTYDPLNRLTNITQGKSAGPTLAQYAYGLDGAGNRTAITETTNYTGTSQTRQMNYGYDPAYRLTSEKDTLQTGITTTYGYDAVGNRLGLTVTNGITNSVTRSNYNELDQLMTSVGPGLSSSYSYVRGNLVGVTTNGAATAYTWDSADRLVGVALPGSVNLSYGYDADGRRVTQRGTGTGTANNNLNYLWDETSIYGDVVLESDSGTGAAKTSYVLSSSQGELISQKRAGFSAADYFLRDGQGSTRALVDNTGALVSGQNYGYSAFGKLLNGQTASSAGTNYQYTGQQSDSLSGLYDLRARYYNPAEGRFLSQDKADYNLDRNQELNRYNYSTNNPINFLDPSGFSIFGEIGQILKTVAACIVACTRAFLATELGRDIARKFVMFLLAQAAIGIGAETGVYSYHSTKLSKNLGGTSQDQMDAHHLIPTEFVGANPIIAQAQRANPSWDNDAAYNGILLPENTTVRTQKGLTLPAHTNSHRNYSHLVEQGLQDLFDRSVADGGWSDQKAYSELRSLADQLRQRVRTWPSDTLN